MRRCLILSTATILCCGVSSLASGQYLLSQSPTPAPQLYLAQNADSAEADQDAPSVESTDARFSPFDLFSEDSTSTAASAGTNGDTTGSSPEASTGDKSDTTTVPVGRHQQPISPADSILAGAMATAPNGYFAPAQLSNYQYRAPNPMVSFMQREWCVDGLWDNYSSERAAQCARQYERLAGCQHRHCGYAGNAGCYQSPNCLNCFGRQPGHCGRARYFQQGGPCGCVADGCNNASSVIGTCPDVQAASLPGQPTASSYAQSKTVPDLTPAQYNYGQSGPNGRPVPINAPVQPTNQGGSKVAAQTLNVIR